MLTSLCFNSLKMLQSEVTGVLRRMYGKDVPEPEAIHCSKWSTNPLTLGSYPVLNYGTTRDDLKNLTRPVDNLHFAGLILSFNI